MTPALEALYTPDEAATMLRCSGEHVYDLIRKEKLRAYRIGKERGIRIPASAIQEFLSGASIGQRAEQQQAPATRAVVTQSVLKIGMKAALEKRRKQRATSSSPPPS